MSSAPAKHQPGQSGPGNHPALAIWARLSVQLSTFSHVIAIARDEYDAWSLETRANIKRMFIGETGLQEACYVADTAGARIFLGDIEDLNNADVFVVRIPGMNLPVMFYRAAILGRRPQESPHNMMRQQHDLLMQRFGAPPPYGMPHVQQGPQQYAMANGLNMNRPISTESVAHPPLAIRSAAAPTHIQAPVATPPAALGTSLPRTPEEQDDSPTGQGQSSRKRKSAPKAPRSRKRTTSSVTRGRPLRREGSNDDEDDNRGQNNNQDAGNNNGSSNNGSVNVNLARLPSLTTTATATVGALALNHDSVYHKGKTYRSGAPRPQNAFILFRSAKHKEVKEKHPGLPNADISKVIGTMWRDLPYQERQIWLERQKQAAREHEERNPGYKFNPQQPEEKKEQKRLKKQERELQKQLKQQLKQKSTQQQRSPPAPAGSSMTPFSNQVAEMTLQSGISRVMTPSSSARVTGVIARHQQPTPVSLQRVQPEDPFQAMTSYQSAPAQQATQAMMQNMRSSSMLNISRTGTANMPQAQQQLSAYFNASPSQTQLTTEASPAASRVSADFSPSSGVSTVPTEHSTSSLFETEGFGEGFHQAMGDFDLSSINFDMDSIQVPGEMIDPTLEAPNNDAADHDAPCHDAADHESVSNLSVIREFVNIEVPNNDAVSDSGVVSLDDSSSRSHSFSTEFSFVHADILSDNGDAATTAAAHSEVDNNNEFAIEDLDLGEFTNTDMLRDDSAHSVALPSHNLDETEQHLLSAFSAAGYLTSAAGLPSFPTELSPALPIGNREDMPAAANASSSQQATRAVDAEFQAMMNFDNSDESFTGFVDLLGEQED